MPHSPITYFISDLHLTEKRPDITAAFLHFLTEYAEHAEALYILGDLFEYWVGDDIATPFHHTIINALKALQEKGTAIFILTGNRDFLIGKQFASAIEATLLPEHHTLNLYGVPTLLMHGDLLCTRDIEYLNYRKKAQHPITKKIVLALPAFLRIRLAERVRRKSYQHQANKPDPSKFDVTQSEVVKTLLKFQVTQLIHGHTHKPSKHTLAIQGKTCTRFVLGDWQPNSVILRASAEGVDLLQLTAAGLSSS